jgi:hypothetical protein
VTPIDVAGLLAAFLVIARFVALKPAATARRSAGDGAPIIAPEQAVTMCDKEREQRAVAKVC